ncbi:DNA phosphorothioation-dependent restriction protein DptF [Anaerobacillus sp. MEB173]|uniref:DNA phosphorothioation-dependent restriction protein DptF n=1 Tax=Anaerobacillus sp. MEB173 TaxID=3383345 RepID=UPI003F8E8F52
MEIQQYLFSFLEEINKTAADSAKEIERLIYEDPKGTVIRARLFLEEIIKDIFRREEYNYDYFKDLNERIIYLTREGIFEKEIQQVIYEIRKTGNKAVHDATFEVDILLALKIFKMMYKLGSWYTEVYSMDIVVPTYRDPKPMKQSLDPNEIQSIIDEAIQGKLNQYLNLSKAENKEQQDNELENEFETDKSVVEDKSNPDEEKEVKVTTNQTDDYFEMDLPEGRSYLLRELKRLQESSQEAVENANSFSSFKNYMHVERDIQKDFEEILEKTSVTERPELILLSGSVGDGKSHLLAYFNEKAPEKLSKYTILNDATESFSPNKNAIETLSELLDEFSDEKIETSKSKIILAINLGVLHNFLTATHEDKTFNKLKIFVEESELFTQKVTTKYSSESFHLIGFSDYQSYELTEQGPTSSFYSGIFSKVFSDDANNPFYKAYENDLERNVKGIIHENFEFLMNEDVQYEIIQLVIQGIVKNKLVISSRAFYNFIADLIIPESYSEILDFEWNDFEKLNQTVPYLLFKRKERSVILKTMSNLDPIHIRSDAIDQIIIEINTLSDWNTIIKKYTEHSIAKGWLEPLTDQEEIIEFSTVEVSQALIRLAYLTNPSFAKDIIPTSYKNYMSHLYSFNKVSKKQIENFYKEVIQTIYKWRGSPKNGYVYINKPNERYRIAQQLNLTPSMDHLSPHKKDVLTSFKTTLTLVFLGKNNDERVQLDVDYPLYRLLSDVQKGYCPNKKDEEDAIKFVEFLDQIMKFGNQNEELLIHIPVENKLYKLTKGFFGGYVFEKGHV